MTKRTLLLVLNPFSDIIKKDWNKSNPFLLAGDEARTRDILLGKEAFYH